MVILHHLVDLAVEELDMAVDHLGELELLIKVELEEADLEEIHIVLAEAVEELLILVILELNKVKAVMAVMAQHRQSQVHQS